MSNGWPIPSPHRRGIRSLLVPAFLAVLLVGCAQGEKRSGGGMFGSGNGGTFGSGNGGIFGSGNGGMFGANAPMPLFPKAAAPRSEPDLRVQAELSDPKLLARQSEGGVDPRDERTVTDSTAAAPRVELFRSASSSRSLEPLPPVN